VSTSSPLLEGVYDGSLGDDTLTFEVTGLGGVLGALEMTIEIQNGVGAAGDTLPCGTGCVPGAPVATSFGITLALSLGVLASGDSFEVDVSNSVGTAVQPDNPFDGTGDLRPDFEPGLGVVAGSFQINGVGISVAANDTLTAVLDRITQSAAGVTAAFDAGTERVTLTQKTDGSAASIALGVDDTGFFAATKLSNGSLVTGEDAEHLLPIAQVPELVGISTGTFEVDGVALALDVGVDSLQDVLDRIAAFVPGVTASLDTGTGTLSITSSGHVVLDDGTTGLFSALGLTTFTSGAGASHEPVIRHTAAVRRGLRRVFDGLDELLSTEFSGLAKSEELRLRSELKAIVTEAADVSSSRDVVKTNIGLEFDFRQPGAATIDRACLNRALDESAGDVGAFVHGTASAPGFVEGLEALLAETSERVVGFLGDDASGLAFDLLA